MYFANNYKNIKIITLIIILLFISNKSFAKKCEKEISFNKADAPYLFDAVIFTQAENNQQGQKSNYDGNENLNHGTGKQEGSIFRGDFLITEDKNIGFYVRVPAGTLPLNSQKTTIQRQTPLVSIKTGSNLHNSFVISQLRKQFIDNKSYFNPLENDRTIFDKNIGSIENEATATSNANTEIENSINREYYAKKFSGPFKEILKKRSDEQRILDIKKTQEVFKDSLLKMRLAAVSKNTINEDEFCTFNPPEIIGKEKPNLKKMTQYEPITQRDLLKNEEKVQKFFDPKNVQNRQLNKEIKEAEAALEQQIEAQDEMNKRAKAVENQVSGE